MLKAQLKFPKLWVEVEAKSQKELFFSMAEIGDVFGESQCGCCESTNIKPVVRTSKSKDGKKTYQYPEYHCMDCTARLTICLNNDDSGTLYAMRKLTDNNEPATGSKKGKFGDHKGWTKFRGDKNGEE